jgi:hypothetical protein
VNYFKPQEDTLVTVDLEKISDPVQRFRAELIRSVAIMEEFDDFIKVIYLTLLV